MPTESAPMKIVNTLALALTLCGALLAQPASVAAQPAADYTLRPASGSISAIV